jgi:serine/threonine protein kinase/tetratricopeptide (TPR) repeat protein
MNVVKSVHPTDEILASYGLGKLDDASAESVGGHLEQCADCQRRVGELSSDSFLGRVREAGRGGGESRIDATLSFVRGTPPSGPPPAADTIPPGLADHPDYVLKRELGRGGMGVVYLAHNTMMGRDEVLKVMNRHIMEKPGVLERFQREIRAVAKLRHPNIVAAYTAFRIDGGLVFAMEYVEGLDLAKMVKLKGPLPVVHATYFAYQAALGLQHAHERGMIHRDMKPHNLMLTGDGKARIVKVLVFGLAKASLEGEADHSLTREGQALGTPDYIAPEQILNAVDVDVRADIYSLGGTLYYLLMGRPPFSANSLYDIYQAHISRDINPLNLERPEIPTELAALVAKMMAKEARRRFQTPLEVARALAPFFKKGGAPPPAPVPRSHQNIPVARPPAPRPPANVPAAIKPPPLPAPIEVEPKPGWESLVAVPADADLPIRPVATRPKRRRIKKSVYIAALGILGVALFAAWLGTLRIKTENGTIVLEGLKDDDVVEVDGLEIPKITIRKTSEGEPYLTLTAEKHGIRVATKDGAEILAKGDLTIQPNGLQTLYVQPAAELNSLAWKLATDPSDGKRNGKKALRLAAAACEQDGFRTPAYLDTLAAAHAEVGEFDAAVKREIEALARHVAGGLAGYHSRLHLYREKKPYRTGAVFLENSATNDSSILALNAEAWKLATDPDPANRDGAKAVQLAALAAIKDHYNSHTYLDTLAAACAEAGYCDEAVMWQTKAITLDPADEPSSEYRRRLALYRSKMPYHQPNVAVPTPTEPALIPPLAERNAFVFSGDWRIEGDELVQSSGEGPASLQFGDTAWSEYDLTVDVNSVQGNEGNWTLIHCNGANNVNFYPGGNANTAHGLGILTDGRAERATVPGSITHGVWYTVKLEVRGASVVCFLDGWEVMRNASLPHSQGQVGLGTFFTVARFRNLKITAPDGKTLWEGLPVLP